MPTRLTIALDFEDEDPPGWVAATEPLSRVRVSANGVSIPGWILKREHRSSGVTVDGREV